MSFSKLASLTNVLAAGEYPVSLRSVQSTQAEELWWWDYSFSSPLYILGWSAGRHEDKSHSYRWLCQSASFVSASTHCFAASTLHQQTSCRQLSVYSVHPTHALSVDAESQSSGWARVDSILYRPAPVPCSQSVQSVVYWVSYRWCSVRVNKAIDDNVLYLALIYN